jgi:hypothetical protein
MSGPVSGGRLAACFDWGVLWPWNCPAELGVKVILGIWIAFWPHVGEESAMLSTLFLINAITLISCILYVWAAVVFRPYVHFIDCLSTICSRLALALTVGASLVVTGPSDSPLASSAWGSFVPVLLTIATLMLVPLCVLLLVSVILTKMATMDMACKGCSQGNKAAEELLEKFWQEGHKEEEFWAHVDIGKHMIDVVFQDMYPAPRLPALVRSPVEFLRLAPNSGRAGAYTVLPNSGKPWLSLVPSLLFPMAGTRNDSVSRGASPIAALTEQPDDGRLLFEDKKDNGGLEWREVLHSFIDPIDEDCATGAETIIADHEFPTEGAGSEKTLVIIELVAADNSPAPHLIR